MVKMYYKSRALGLSKSMSPVAKCLSVSHVGPKTIVWPHRNTLCIAVIGDDQRSQAIETHKEVNADYDYVTQVMISSFASN